MKTLMLASAALLALGGPAAAQQGGCEVVATLTDWAPPPSGIDAPLTIAPAFNANVTNAQRNVILQAIAEWTTLIQSAGHLVNPFTITFLNGPLSGSTLARANVTWNASSGTLTGATVTIDNDGSSLFFVDPTPGSNEEFDQSGNCTLPACTGVSDLLSVMRHELGHCMGWLGAYGTTNPLTATYISGTTFDPSRLNIAMDPALTSHSNAAVHPGDLMTPSINSGIRRAINMYPTAALIGRNIDHDLTLKFVDGAQVSFPIGSADLPWNSMAQVAQSAAPGAPILLIPSTIGATGSAVITGAHEIFVARGGAVLVK